jgi:hypothetical protein
MSDICAITDMLIIPFVTQLRENFYRSFGDSDERVIKFSPNIEGG